MKDQGICDLSLACAHRAHKLGLPLLAEFPLSLVVRVAGDAGKLALGTDAIGEIYGKLAAARLITAAERTLTGA